MTPHKTPAPMPVETLIARLHETYTEWNNPPSDELPEGAGIVLEAAERIATLESEISQLRDGSIKFAAANATLGARCTELEAALKPFSDMAVEMFARGWDASNVALALDTPNDPHRVAAEDFFCARKALAESEGMGE